MDVSRFCEILGSDFYSGVPDSQLKALCNFLIDKYGIDPKHHIIGANEGNCTALAAGYHLATGKIPVVYMQNSGQGNVINPVASLLNDKVYAIPVIFIIGWRGEPGIHDEPQHIYQGEVTLKLLEDMDIETCVVDSSLSESSLQETMSRFRKILESGKSVAFVVRKGALTFDGKVVYNNDNPMTREEIIRLIANVSNEDPIISTTGKASRELFEIREAAGQSHKYDFLSVGSMGHSNSIGLGVAINKPSKKIWCIDGDGALIMHMGSMAVIGNIKPNNMVHILINNGSHETVGGMPTVGNEMDWVSIAKGCGYPYAASVSEKIDLERELEQAKERNALSFIEVKCAIGARTDLGRPTTTAIENKINFMEFIAKD